MSVRYDWPLDRLIAVTFKTPTCPSPHRITLGPTEGLRIGITHATSRGYVFDCLRLALGNEFLSDEEHHQFHSFYRDREGGLGPEELDVQVEIADKDRRGTQTREFGGETQAIATGTDIDHLLEELTASQPQEVPRRFVPCLSVPQESVAAMNRNEVDRRGHPDATLMLYSPPPDLEKEALAVAIATGCQVCVIASPTIKAFDDAE